MADTDVAPATDKHSTSLFAGDQNPNAGTSHLTQGPNSDDGTPVPPETESESSTNGQRPS